MAKIGTEDRGQRTEASCSKANITAVTSSVAFSHNCALILPVTYCGGYAST
jgi:hypothetical protein